MSQLRILLFFSVKAFSIALILVFISFKALCAEDPLSSDPYIRLGLSRDASEEEIKNVYRKLRSKYHPDHTDDKNRKAFQNVQEAYDILSGNAARPNDAGSEPEWAPKESSVSRDEVLGSLYDYFENGSKDSALEFEILYKTFRLEKTDIEFMRKDPRFNDIREKIFSSSVWADDTPLFDTFIQGWGFYEFRFSFDLLAKLFAQMSPNDLRLQKVIYEFDFKSRGRQFQTEEERKSWPMIAVAKLLSLAPYRGTKAGERLLDNQYKHWQSMKNGEDLSPYPRDLWVIEILKLLDVPEYRTNPKLLEMVKEVPELLRKKVIGFGQVFSYPEMVQTYRGILQKHATIFHGLVSNAPIDDLIWFYNTLSVSEQNLRKSEEVAILTRLFTLKKYDFEAVTRDKEFWGILNKIANRPIWQDRSNDLFSIFINEWGLYQCRFFSEVVAKIFSQVNPEDRDMQYILFDADFYSPGKNFATKEGRFEFLTPIAGELLKLKPYLGTSAGQRLIRHNYKLWTNFKLRRDSAGYMGSEWILGLLKTLDIPELRNDPTMIKIYKDIPALVEAGRVKFDYSNSHKTYLNLREEYADVFAGRKYLPKPKICSHLFAN